MAGARAGWLATTAVAALLATHGEAARAQFEQYSPPGGVVQVATPSGEDFEAVLEEARWRLGPLRLDPWLGLRNASYVSNVFGTADDAGSDFTASFGLGLRGYLPLGDAALFSLYALPEYVWWADARERRRLNGRYGGGFFVFFERLSFSLTAGRSEEQQFFSSELQQLTHSRAENAAASLDLKLVGSLYLFGSIGEQQRRNLLDEVPGSDRFSALDRTERVVRAGVRLRFLDRVRLGFGYETSDVELDKASPLQLDNTGDGPALEVDYTGPYFAADLDLVQRSLEPEPGSDFVPFDGVTGRLSIALRPERQLRPTFYTARNMVYALADEFAYFEDKKTGLALAYGIGQRFSAQIFGEIGDNGYTARPGVLARRHDDVSSYGGSVSFPLSQNRAVVARLSLGALVTKYDSSLPGFDREVSSLTFDLDLGLSLAADELGWP